MPASEPKEALRRVLDRLGCELLGLVEHGLRPREFRVGFGGFLGRVLCLLLSLSRLRFCVPLPRLGGVDFRACRPDSRRQFREVLLGRRRLVLGVFLARLGGRCRLFCGVLACLGVLRESEHLLGLLLGLGRRGSRLEFLDGGVAFFLRAVHERHTVLLAREVVENVVQRAHLASFGDGVARQSPILRDGHELRVQVHTRRDRLFGLRVDVIVYLVDVNRTRINRRLAVLSVERVVRCERLVGVAQKRHLLRLVQARRGGHVEVYLRHALELAAELAILR